MIDKKKINGEQEAMKGITISPEIAESYYSKDYIEARNRFIQSAVNKGAQMHSLKLDAKGAKGEDLSIDIAWLGSKNPSRVIFHSSGVHGPEGFAGSAVQLGILDNLPKIPEDTALIMIHCVNPYGMSHMRRTNENNVDLNRNWLTDSQGFNRDSDDLRKIETLANPDPNGSIEDHLSHFRNKLNETGVINLAYTLMQAQSIFPAGLGYTGNGFQQSYRLLNKFISDNFKDANRIILVDVHTGLGKEGEEMLFWCNSSDNFDKDVIERIGSPESGYVVPGCIENMFVDIFKGKSVDTICQEFGTIPLKKMVDTLFRENIGQIVYGSGNDKEGMKMIKDAFYVNKRKWKFSIVQKGLSLVGLILRSTKK